MHELGDLAVRNQWGRTPAIRSPGRVYTHRDLYTSVQKVATFFTYYGGEGGTQIDVEPEAQPEVVLSILGAARLGAIANLTPTGDGEIVVVPAAKEDEYDLDPDQSGIVYDGFPSGPRFVGWELDVWDGSARTGPRLEAAPEDGVLRTEDRTYSHGELLDAADRVVEEYGIEEGTEVAVRAPMGNPGTIAAGIVAPLKVGGTVLFPGTDDLGDVGVGFGVAEQREVDPTTVFED
ncbi:acetyl-CoA synthetase [Haloparvum sp. AD34]